jgi:centrosomal protein CEP128
MTSPSERLRKNRELYFECNFADKLKRSALTHAIINGNANVASYLLYLGADPNRKDSSSNTLVHYAAAYGWYHCLKMLIKDAGAKYDVENDWKVSHRSIKLKE